MRKFIFLLLASVIVGFATYALMHWLFKIAYETSLSSGIAVGVTGLVIEYLKPIIIRNKEKSGSQ